MGWSTLSCEHITRGSWREWGKKGGGKAHHTGIEGESGQRKNRKAYIDGLVDFELRDDDVEQLALLLRLAEAGELLQQPHENLKLIPVHLGRLNHLRVHFGSKGQVASQF